MRTQHSNEISRGVRFAFGENWKQFLSSLNDSRIEEAKKSLKEMLELSDLSGKRFLDIGCGSGLFSLAARQLGAEVHSFDYDLQCVSCAEELKHRFFFDDESWKIEEGSVLDDSYLRSIGQFDIVYSCGVLHHTGNMIQALHNAAIPAKEGGYLYISIYNDQDIFSKMWASIKKLYCSSLFCRYLITISFIPLFTMQSLAIGVFKYGNPIGHFVNYKNKRGMSIYHDWIDWLGGYPFEVSKPEKIFLFYKDLGFRLTNMTTTNRLGCNQFVFQREVSLPDTFSKV